MIPRLSARSWSAARLRQGPAEAATKGSAMLEQAERAGQEYNAAVSQTAGDPYMQDFAWEVREQVTTFKVKAEFQQDIETLMIPQFSRSSRLPCLAMGYLNCWRKTSLPRTSP